jgi:mRNA interferase RelE/StbE
MYAVETTNDFEKQFKKLDRSVQVLVAKWVNKHLIETDKPRAYGKALIGNLSGYWRYRIGDYRLIVEINDRELVIIAIGIAHRSEIYKDR